MFSRRVVNCDDYINSGWKGKDIVAPESFALSPMLAKFCYGVALSVVTLRFLHQKKIRCILLFPSAKRHLKAFYLNAYKILMNNKLPNASSYMSLTESKFKH